MYYGLVGEEDGVSGSSGELVFGVYYRFLLAGVLCVSLNSLNLFFFLFLHYPQPVPFLFSPPQCCLRWLQLFGPSLGNGGYLVSYSGYTRFILYVLYLGSWIQFNDLFWFHIFLKDCLLR